MIRRRSIVWTGGFLLLMWILTGCFQGREAPSQESGPARLHLGIHVEEGKEKTRFRWELVNVGTESAHLVFGSDRRSELTVVDRLQQMVFRYPEEKGSDGAQHNTELEPGEKLTWEAEWDRRLKDGTRVKGEHVVRVEILLTEANGQKLPSATLQTERTWKPPVPFN
ncbi:BsuPI-related putative proteinase inhibitor [Salinithrix halophila]|uniref:Intracellular proteinase inhibitor BsuPI domain-containing protein n=1 Tax=Salinithrix halophila TaxID=1485204 RepID=A0ABV8JDP7_9BACL